MSIEINWDTLLQDEDGLAEKVRAFLDNQFQSLTLPPYIKALSVTSFDFGTQAPEITIKNITSPFLQFYSDEFDSDSDSPPAESIEEELQIDVDRGRPSIPLSVPAVPSHSRQASFGVDGEEDYKGDVNDENGIGPSSSLHYFHSTLSSSLLSNVRSPLYTPFQHAASSLTGTSSTTPVLRSPMGSPAPRSPPRLSEDNLGRLNRLNELRKASADEESKATSKENDVQLFLEVCYSGNMRLGVTATLLLNYPSPSFVSLPLKLTITGLEIRSLAVVAYIANRIHASLICDIDEDGDSVTLAAGGNSRIDVIRDIKIESEIGAHDNGQVLRNVGKVERFVLERVRSLIRDELAWPGWITFEI